MEVTRNWKGGMMISIEEKYKVRVYKIALVAKSNDQILPASDPPTPFTSRFPIKWKEIYVPLWWFDPGIRVYFCPWPRLHPLTCRNGSQTRFDTGAILVNRFRIGFPIVGNPPYALVVPEKYFILSWNTSFSEGQFVPSSIGVTNGGHHNQTSDIHVSVFSVRA